MSGADVVRLHWPHYKLVTLGDVRVAVEVPDDDGGGAAMAFAVFSSGAVNLERAGLA